LKKKFTDGRSWYDIISESMEARGHDDNPEYIYDGESADE
jgi:hypothetical protein